MRPEAHAVEVRYLSRTVLRERVSIEQGTRNQELGTGDPYNGTATVAATELN
jgi:hypothetical protein